MEEIAGSCLCGAVHFLAKRAPRWVAHCHCTLCRRAHGAAFVTWVGYDHDAVLFTSGTEALAVFRSSEVGRRHFCSRCGSQVSFEGDRWPGEIHIPRALMPDDAPLPVPMAHVYWDNHATWFTADDTLPKSPGAS